MSDTTIRIGSDSSAGRHGPRQLDPPHRAGIGSGVTEPVIDLRQQPRPVDLGFLPEFPVMSSVRAEHIQPLRAFALNFDDYSDFNGISLFGWSGSVPDGYRVARHGDNLVVEFSDYLDGSRFLSFLGCDRVDRTAEVLVAHAGAHGLGDELHLVPHETAVRLDPRQWDLQDDPDAADYVYRVADVAALQGKPYRSLRYSHNAWQRKWGSISAIEWMDIGDLAARRDEVDHLLNAWQRRGSEGARQSAQESRAIFHLLASAGDLPPGVSRWSGVCTTDGELSAVFINEREDAQRLCGHFLKMSDRPFGDRLYSWFFVELCRRAHAEGITLLNLQQDLGIPGLRSTKQQLRPSARLSKYTVRRAS